jgi:phospholipase A1
MKYKSMMSTTWPIALLAGLTSHTAWANSEFEQCMRDQIELATNDITVGQLRGFCTEPEPNKVAVQDIDPKTAVEPNDSALERRISFEERQADNPFSLLPHKPNYIIISNNLASPNEAPFTNAYPDQNIAFQPWETKFQLSFKVPVVRGLFNERADLFVGYTNRSFWQQFNKAGSSPFRDSNHEPEIWLSFKTDYDFLGLHNSIIRTGVVHQSNGQSGGLSRSWNRVYADFILDYNNWYFSAKPWWRIPDSKDNDDNPDIDDYLGNFELTALYKRGEHTFDLMVRDNLQTSDNHGAFQLGWSFPIHNSVRGYVQWFNGYGESLIDYNAYSNSIGFGIQFSDWL